MRAYPYWCLVLLLLTAFTAAAQLPNKPQWSADGNALLELKNGNITSIDFKTGNETILLEGKNLNIASFNLVNDKILLFTNTAKVWRYNTRGDYTLYDTSTKTWTPLGKGRPAQSLMYAKISPDGKKVAYTSEHNLFSEDLQTHRITKLTATGTRKRINGTFDWVYEEEFGCRDGFRWSPDSKHLAYWQVDASATKEYWMLNTTDSIYSRVIPVEYPKTGEQPSVVKIGVVSADGGGTKWMAVDGDPAQHYIPRMEWADAQTLVLQQLDRRQQQSRLFYADIKTGKATVFYSETDTAWIDIKSRWNEDDPTGWDWIKGGREFLWVSEKDGWRHIYKVNRDGKKETLLTPGNYDIASIRCIDEARNYIYFMASPANATQLYLYRTTIDGGGPAELVSPAALKGTHEYSISPNGSCAIHNFSSHQVAPLSEWISLPEHQALERMAPIPNNPPTTNTNITYTTVTTAEGVTLDAWINAPPNFDSSKKYPVIFYVYGEPGASVVADQYGNQQDFLYKGDLQKDGYFYIGVDNRGTPALKGAAWRKAVYRKIGRLNVDDMAMAAKKLLELPWLDKERVAVWGWSGGGSSTLSLLFRYPDIFQTGIAVAAVTNLLFYDNIYQERYMGLPQDNQTDSIKGSPVTYAKNLQGNLLYIHGTGDDNVHYSNAELLVNELVRYNKQFQFMPYPNRTHSLSEGKGTFQHLQTLYTNYLRTNCPPGGREQ